MKYLVHFTKSLLQLVKAQGSRIELRMPSGVVSLKKNA